MKTATFKSDNKIHEGSQVLVSFQDDVTYLIQVKPERSLAIHRGRPIRHADLIGKSFGEWIETASGRALLIEPTIEDLIMKARRESGIIYPKDAALILMRLGIKSGSHVVEIGTGSGALTLALAQQVAPHGMVDTYDLRDDFIDLARRKIEHASLSDFVRFHERDPEQGFGVSDADAVVSDVPEPWREIEFIKASLKSGGRVAALNPTYNQIEQTAEALHKTGFVKVEALEVLVRGILARHGKTRPEQRMVSHTEFIVFGLKPAE